MLDTRTEEPGGTGPGGANPPDDPAAPEPRPGRLAGYRMLLLLGVLAVVGNTIRLEIYSRRAEIEVTKLVTPITVSMSLRQL